MIPKLSPVKRLSIGLVSMTITVVLTAQLLGILPNETEGDLSKRQHLIENLATQLTRYANRQPLPVIKSLLDSVVQQHEDIISAAIRNRSGLLLIEIGEHKKNWSLRGNEQSTSEQIQAPIFASGKIWGKLELHFQPLASSSILGIAISNSILLILFIAIAGSILFGSYLKKALQYLDPSSVIPDRVRNAMDIISEGILILDERERIILVNRALSEQIGVPAKGLIGKKPDTMQWDRRKRTQKIPWHEALKTNKRVNDSHMSLRTKHLGIRSFLVTAAPIAAEDGRLRGAMVTFKDVTQLQKRNKQLNSAVHTLKKSQAEVKKKNQELAILAARDPLTACLNRRAFFELVEPRLAAAKKTNEPVTCIMLDIDHFKTVNDNYGHSAGDAVIRKIARTVIDSLRKHDLPCRYGGEEFCLYLDNTTVDQAYILAERIRNKIENIDFTDDPATKDLKITASFGLSDNRFGASSITDIIEQADQALYYSKEHGRNRASIWKEVFPLIEKEKSNIEHLDKTGRQITGRPLFINMLQQVSIDCSKNHEKFVAMLINIDMFKRVNNIIGHHAGDDLLIQIQNRIEKVLHHEKIKAFIGKQNRHIEVLNLKGDEYGVIIPSLGKPEIIAKIAQHIKNNVNRPFDTGTHEINLTCSIGSSIFPVDGDNPETIMRNIELATSKAKEHGRNYHQAYLDEFNTNTDDDLILENKLHSALQNNEIYLHYQPKIDLKTGLIMGLEALARWRNPELGEIPPMRFIPIAEQSGLIHDLGLYVLKTACIESNKWIENGFDHLRIAVNLSAVQLKKHDFLESVFAILHETGYNPYNLELEVTENMVMENIDTVTPVLYQLNEKGITISIDDFGIGYSSLNYIKRFPIEVIKIDRSFVMNITEDQDDQSIVSAIIAMAHALNLKVVAEGADTNQQLRLLQQMNCDQLQGFIFSRPLPYKDIQPLLQENKHNASRLFIPTAVQNKG